MEHSVVGKRLPSISSKAKSTGQARYAADITLPGMLAGKILRSPHAHARIAGIDTSRAERLAGVKAVITGQDIAPVKYGFAFRFTQFCDEYLLAIDRVRYPGEAVAAVAAVDEDTAAEALDLIKVEYEPLPAVFDPEEAMKPGAPAVHDNVENNVSVHMLHDFGDVEGAFRQSDRVREERFVLQPQAHAPMEPHAVVASADPDGKLTVWAAKQSPFRVRYALSQTLEKPEGMIRVIRPTLGGGFGGKGETMALDLSASLLSLRTGRPVSIVYDREEALCMARSRHPMIIDLKVGVKKDGTLMAASCRAVADGGAYMSSGAVALYVAASNLVFPYRLTNFRFDGYRVYTNKQPAGAMRGHGGPQPRFAMECLLDTLANDLGIDPVELRLRNGIEAGYIAPNEYEALSCGYKETLHRAAESSSWKEKRSRKQAWRGIGVGSYSFVSGNTAQLWDTKAAMTSAVVRMEEGGAVHLVTGASDIGQGTDTALCQIAAEELGGRLEDMTITAADTELCPLDWGTGGSRVTFQAGNAVRAAAQDARNQILKAAADQLEARPEDLELRDHQVYVKGSPDRGVPLRQVVSAVMSAASGMPVSGRGSFNQKPAMPDFGTGKGNMSFAYSFGNQVAEVQVDPETGQVEVRKMTVVHDCGFAINPLSVEGQIDGSAIMGAGYALTEDLGRKEGVAMNTSFLDYRIPTALEACPVASSYVETMDPGGPFGAKEVGEGLMLGAPPAIANAIANAIGVAIRELPITPEKVLKAIEDRGSVL